LDKSYFFMQFLSKICFYIRNFVFWV
jgi:hypothetical protein